MARRAALALARLVLWLVWLWLRRTLSGRVVRAYGSALLALVAWVVRHVPKRRVRGPARLVSGRVVYHQGCYL